MIIYARYRVEPRYAPTKHLSVKEVAPRPFCDEEAFRDEDSEGGYDLAKHDYVEGFDWVHVIPNGDTRSNAPKGGG